MGVKVNPQNCIPVPDVPIPWIPKPIPKPQPKPKVPDDYFPERPKVPCDFCVPKPPEHRVESGFGSIWKYDSIIGREPDGEAPESQGTPENNKSAPGEYKHKTTTEYGLDGGKPTFKRTTETEWTDNKPSGGCTLIP